MNKIQLLIDKNKKLNIDEDIAISYYAYHFNKFVWFSLIKKFYKNIDIEQYYSYRENLKPIIKKIEPV